MRISVPIRKPRNLVARDLLSPKYRMRVAASKKRYDRNSSKQSVRKEISDASF